MRLLRLATGLLAVAAFVITSSGNASPGTAIRFFGTGSGDTDRIKLRIDAPPNTADVGGGDFTIEFWMKADAGNTGAGCDDWICGNIIVDRDIFGSQLRDYGISVNSIIGTGRLYFGTGGSVEHVLRGDQNVADGGWHHIAVTRVRSSGLKCLYVDGQLDVPCANGTTQDISYPDGYLGSYPNDPFLVVGAEKHDAGPTYPSFFGSVDDIRVWSTARSASQVASNMNVSLGGSEAGLVVYWRLDEGSGTSAGDSSGDGNNGTVKEGTPTAAQWVTSTAGVGYFLVPAITTANFSRMVDFAIIPGTNGQEAVIITQQEQKAWRVSLTGAFAPTLFGDLTGFVGGGGNEEGLLSLTFSPNFLSDGRGYVYYTQGGDAGLPTVLSRFQVVADVMNTGVETRILEIPDFAQNHNGGRILFGRDGYLYLSLGDGGGGGDPNENGQNINSLHGKVLRLKVTGEATYTSPADNPFFGVAGRDEIFAYGLRNPWRYSFDSVTGVLWLGDVGQGQWEEVEPIIKGGNYGWDCYEAFAVYEPAGCPPTGFQFPREDYGHGDGSCAVTGGYVYRGTMMPWLYGWYVYADYCSGKIWALDTTSTTSPAVQIMDTNYQIASFAELPNGELIVFTFANAIYRLAPTSATDTDLDGVSDVTDNCPLISNAGQQNFDSDSQGDTCDADDDADGYTDSVEAGAPLCGNGANNDRFEDAIIDDGCPGGPLQSGSFSEDEFKIGTGTLDPCGNNGWPAELATAGPSANRITLTDLSSFVAPLPRKLNTNANDPGFDMRWDTVPGSAAGTMINLQDMSSLTTLAPPMLDGVRAFGGPECPFPP